MKRNSLFQIKSFFFYVLYTNNFFQLMSAFEFGCASEFDCAFEFGCASEFDCASEFGCASKKRRRIKITLVE